MKKTLLILSTMLAMLATSAQTPSDCTIPADLDSIYARDMANMIVRRIIDLQHPDTAFVHIPQVWKDTIGGGLAAIFHATILPERDTIFNLYCVHDNTSYPQTHNSLLVEVDTTYAWTQAWQNLQTLTGDPFIDGMMTTYSLEVTEFYNWSFGNYAVLNTDRIWNTFALMDSLEIAPGIIYCEPNYLIGGAGKIQYSMQGDDRYYDFYFEFNDCFDGCDNYRKWQFKVAPDCEVNYLGFTDWGAFGIEPLPPPVNCNTFITSLRETEAAPFSLFPNPANNQLTIRLLNTARNITEIKLTDPGGRILKTFSLQGKETIDINLSDLNKGIYLLMLLEDMRLVSVEKVLKQ